MGSALYIVVENTDHKALPALSSVNGKAVASDLKNLDRDAQRQNVEPLSSFISMDAADAADLLGEDIEDLDVPTEWWPAEEPLATVIALIQHVKSEETAVRADLSAYQKVLETARDRNLRVRFAIDI